MLCINFFQDKWRGIPTRLNNIPHSRDIRAYFYEDVLQATIRSIKDGNTRLRVRLICTNLFAVLHVKFVAFISDYPKQLLD